jgi:signal transduction histidine kinase
VTVKDQGRGMLETQVHRIQSFMQFDRERHEQQGVGLGLMIAKRLTEVHQGTLHVMSTEGTGTTVKLSLPLLPDSRII